MYIYKLTKLKFRNTLKYMGFLVAQMIKNPHATLETWVPSLGEEDNHLEVWVKEQEKRKPGIASLFCLSRLEYRTNGNGL